LAVVVASRLAALLAEPRQPGPASLVVLQPRLKRPSQQKLLLLKKPSRQTLPQLKKPSQQTLPQLKKPSQPTLLQRKLPQLKKPSLTRFMSLAARAAAARVTRTAHKNARQC